MVNKVVKDLFVVKDVVKYPGVSFVVGNLRRGYSESYLIFRDRIFPFSLINRFLLEKVLDEF